MIQLSNLSYKYNTPRGELEIIDDCSFKFEKGVFYSLMAPSGSGKTTLLNIIGLIDEDYRGQYIFRDTDINTLADKEKSRIRAKKMGFVFQNFRLIRSRTVYENIALALEIGGLEINKSEIETLLDKLNLSHRTHHFPDELSGGEAQRVAIARSLIRNPELLIADEPTGNLDLQNADIIMDILKDYHMRGGTVILVTHSHHIAQHAEQQISLVDKKICKVDP